MLLEAPLESFQLEPGNPLPPPSVLKRKIIIKNKKKHHHHHHHHHHKKENASSPEVLPESEPAGNGDVSHHAPPLQTRQVIQFIKNNFYVRFIIGIYLCIYFYA